MRCPPRTGLRPRPMQKPPLPFLLLLVCAALARRHGLVKRGFWIGIERWDEAAWGREQRWTREQAGHSMSFAGVLLAFIYAAFRNEVPRRFRWMLAGGVLLVALSWAFPARRDAIILYPLLLLIGEMARTLWGALRQRVHAPAPYARRRSTARVGAPRARRGRPRLANHVHCLIFSRQHRAPPHPPT